MNTKIRKLVGAVVLALTAATVPVAAHDPGSPGGTPGGPMKCETCSEIRFFGLLIRRCNNCTFSD